MLICASCKKEMKCIKNGVRCRWNGSHVYSGDLFKCPNCGNLTINTGNANSYYDDNFKKTDLDYYMDNFFKDNFKVNKSSLNLRRKTHA